MKKRKRITASLLALCILFCTAPTANAASGLDNFKKGNTYTSTTFQDVSSGEWYEEYVKKVYELGLMGGMGDRLFSPSSHLTVAQSVVLACRLDNTYYGRGEKFTQGEIWYQVYVDYAVKKGIITAAQFSNYDKDITRAEFASILVNALPSSALAQVNTVDDDMIPDVPSTHTYAKAIYTLYRAGVAIGSGEEHQFLPDDYIQRSEAAAIISRMVDKTLRQSVSLTKPRSLPDTSLMSNLTSVSCVKLNGKYYYLGYDSIPVGVQDGELYVAKRIYSDDISAFYQALRLANIATGNFSTQSASSTTYTGRILWDSSTYEVGYLKDCTAVKSTVYISPVRTAQYSTYGINDVMFSFASENLSAVMQHNIRFIEGSGDAVAVNVSDFFTFLGISYSVELTKDASYGDILIIES